MLELSDRISTMQAGIRPGRSRQDQLYRLAADISTTFQLGERTVACFIDLSRAFDRVWKNGLYKKGVPTCLIRWVRGFLRDRSARVEFEQTLSGERSSKKASHKELF
jgi:hypothetical protein